MWDPQTYLAYADERTRPARDLLAAIDVEKPARVVDLGCGTGASTRLLARRWPDADVLGTDSHLARRELGIVNVAETGHVLVDGEKFELAHLDGLYVGCGSEVSFAGEDAAFYFVSAPAGTKHPTTVV